ncbi:MAG: fluoride efflux transporter CrcB [Taibaiella sp.]|nr:fluoride efflux transporter CrcB [Taibaiella sp.]
MLRNFLMVGLGGAAGSMARYGIGYGINRIIKTEFPFGIFTINLAGCLLIGILFGLAQRNTYLQDVGWSLLAVGFCGGFTTFSSFALDNISLAGKQHTGLAILYTLLSVVIGIALCRAGMWLAR